MIALCRAAVVSVVALLLAVSGARAQDDAADARALFERGVEALVDGRFPEARDLLGQSLARQGRPATAFNLVLALLGTEQPLDATGVCERLLADGYGPLAADARAEAERECARAEREVAAILVEVDAADARIAIDGEPVEPDESGLVRVNPGAHLVAAEADGRRADGRVRARRGETVQVSLELGPAIDPSAGTDDSSAPIWPWIALGAGAALVIGIVALVLFSSNEDSPDLVTDPVFGVTSALH